MTAVTYPGPLASVDAEYPNVDPWTAETPTRYRVVTELLDGDGSVIEAAIDAFGAGNCESEEFLPADFNQDGSVDGLDLAVVLANWGQSNAGGDADGDGCTGAQDLAVVLASWTVGG